MNNLKKISLTIILVIIIFLVIFLAVNSAKKEEENRNEQQNIGVALQEKPQGNQAEKNNSQNSEDFFEAPLDRAPERITKKKFGTYVEPGNSPVSPERFRGFHTAIDLEVFPEELEKEVPIRAICSGKIVEKREAQGYGGVVVTSCQDSEEDFTVIYGHLDLASVKNGIGDEIQSGETLGMLGEGYSQETDGERKHLHLGIKKGSEVSLLGYVNAQKELSGWIDPCEKLCQK